MKPIAITSCLILVTLSLYAGEPQAQAKEAKPQSDTRLETVFSAPMTGSIGDSPLVRAAKASKRPGIKSSTVITNETLVRTGGHFTTTTSQQPLPPAAHPANGGVQTDEQWLAERRRHAIESATAAAAAQKAEHEKKLTAARNEQLMEGDTPEAILNDPPPMEGSMQTMKPETPKTMRPSPVQPVPNPPF
ncbi:MAG: hypothetical protein QOC81_169 [Thermoanaerobaculia bacterium]|jgi:hypothetical protein|nr:hypothetical protein [Thermoanaerobaculia bacterium]